ncbi:MULTISPECIES: hypothetical protein [Xanthomonas]|uniref:Uncharacterized protein n=1 Tax=Xanthomonas cucurbitae TaxID=56453 RepID=A0ABY7YA53_9XANT|nr:MULTISPECIES: hypothetical protein [Xanthomonas]WDM66876.1 hypothetical protein K6981_15405 [Xanthomonas cucurbitae]WDM68907.1 hypothetical protein K6981_06470 [Xanthomonas cucurbitae]WDM70753.1 hypothetical protein K6978_15375 [Xanthomonas cucurbitae]WDM72780.1 hypothetical protein K6978_06455 [Xanthomonas cucurbitae]CAG2087632.1 hypothetical protein XCY_001457 [Xanthomonas euroxanthea]
MHLELEALKRASTRSTVTGLLPVIGWALVLLLVAALLAGIWAGNRWAEGRQAVQDRTELRTYIKELQIEVKHLRQTSADSAVSYRQAIARLDAIATLREEDRETNRLQADAVRASLDALLRARPDLRDGRAGADVLRHWRESNTRPSTKPAAANDSKQPAPAVPGSAAASQRPVGNVAGQSRPGRGAVPRLPEQHAPADAGRKRVGNHRMGLVLQGTGASGLERKGVSR